MLQPFILEYSKSCLLVPLPCYISNHICKFQIFFEDPSFIFPFFITIKTFESYAFLGSDENNSGNIEGAP